jgi:hypothetical protein
MPLAQAEYINWQLIFPGTGIYIKGVNMIKSNTCPVCEGKALISVRQLFSKNNYIECASCGIHIDHSRFVIVLISLVVLVIYVLGIDSLMAMELQSVLLITVGTLLLWWVAMWVFVPLVPIKEKPKL